MARIGRKGGRRATGLELLLGEFVEDGLGLGPEGLGLSELGLGISESALGSSGRDQGRGLGSSHVTCLRHGPGSGRSGPSGPGLAT